MYTRLIVVEKNYSCRYLFNGMSEIDSRMYNAILESIDCGVFITDPGYRITTFNRAASKITGFSTEEAVGSFCYEIFRTNICQKNCALKQTLSTGKRVEGLTLDILSRDGRIVPVVVSTNALLDPEGNIIGGIETFRDIRIIEELRREVRKSYQYEDIFSKNHRMLQIFDILPDIAESDANVLIQGPSGSGKEVFARAIHNTGRRKNGPFIAVNCGALPDTLLESELFGYKKGAFTDAVANKPGRFSLADGGTIFLDEISDTSPALQVKLLRVIQEKTFEPLGGVEPVHVDVRIIAATNRDLRTLVEKDRFREDLYYRLNVIKIDLPPLRERREDIPLLVQVFIDKFNSIMGKNIEGMTADALSILMGHDFPGNIRELENIIEHAFVMSKSRYIDVNSLPEELKRTASYPSSDMDGLRGVEKAAIMNALRIFDGNRSKAAEFLKINRTTMWRKMKKFGLLTEE